jgi:hypothetical protein
MRTASLVAEQAKADINHPVQIFFHLRAKFKFLYSLYIPIEKLVFDLPVVCLCADVFLR